MLFVVFKKSWIHENLAQNRGILCLSKVKSSGRKYFFPAFPRCDEKRFGIGNWRWGENVLNFKALYATVAQWQSISLVMRRLWVRFPPVAPTEYPETVRFSGILYVSCNQFAKFAFLPIGLLGQKPRQKPIPTSIAGQFFTLSGSLYACFSLVFWLADALSASPKMSLARFLLSSDAWE